MTSEIEFNAGPGHDFLMWLRTGIRLNGIEQLHEAMDGYSKKWGWPKNLDDARYPLYLLVQALTWLQDADRKKNLERLIEGMAQTGAD